jgi:hypothetical protein
MRPGTGLTSRSLKGMFRNGLNRSPKQEKQ